MVKKKPQLPVKDLQPVVLVIGKLDRRLNCTPILGFFGHSCNEMQLKHGDKRKLRFGSLARTP